MEAERKPPVWQTVVRDDHWLRAKIAGIRQWLPARLRREWLVHSARSAVAATVSLYVARALGLREVYWAALTTVLIIQSTPRAALDISAKRIAGTILGCGLAVLLVTYLGANPLVYGIAILAIGIVSAVARLDESAYRVAGVTLTIVMLAAGSSPVGIVGIHRFIETIIGIVVGLVISAIWPEKTLDP